MWVAICVVAKLTSCARKLGSSEETILRTRASADSFARVTVWGKLEDGPALACLDASRSPVTAWVRDVVAARLSRRTAAPSSKTAAAATRTATIDLSAGQLSVSAPSMLRMPFSHMSSSTTRISARADVPSAAGRDGVARKTWCRVPTASSARLPASARAVAASSSE